MILRGVFLARQIDMDWFLRDGVNRIYPQAWQALLQAAAAEAGEDVLQKLCLAVFGNEEAVAKRGARQWLAWGGQVALGNEYRDDDQPLPETAVKQVQMECIMRGMRISSPKIRFYAKRFCRLFRLSSFTVKTT